MKKNKLFIANWKMNLNAQASGALAAGLKKELKDGQSTQVVVCPSFTSLPAASKALADSSILLGAQNVSWQDKGSLTGEISLSMLEEHGVKYVIVGHSERRQQLGETEEMINQKLQAILRADLTPILCVGETFEERQQGRKDFVIAGQVESALKKIQLNGRELFIAYEPVWVIGSGQAVKLDEAEHASRVIKQVLIDLYPDLDLKESTKILYGGSVEAENILTFVKTDLLDGVLVGGASLELDEFIAMVAKMNEL